MATTKEKSSIRKALESISGGNASGLKKHIREALYSKVKRALRREEKKVAKSLIESTVLKENSFNSVSKNFVLKTADEDAKDKQLIKSLVNDAFGSKSTLSMPDLQKNINAVAAKKKLTDSQKKQLGSLLFLVHSEVAED